jgi:hypothetical protein
LLPKGVTHIRAPHGVKGLTAIRVHGGRLQVFFHGHALYRFVSDSKKGEATGQGVENDWFGHEHDITRDHEDTGQRQLPFDNDNGARHQIAARHIASDNRSANDHSADDHSDDGHPTADDNADDGHPTADDNAADKPSHRRGRLLRPRGRSLSAESAHELSSRRQPQRPNPRSWNGVST